MTQRRIYIAEPSEREPIREHVRCLHEGMCAIAAKGWGAVLGESLESFRPVSLARNVAVTRFLAGGYDDLVFIDDDVVWQDGALIRLLEHPVDCVAGVYPRRCAELSFPVIWDQSKPEIRWDEATKLISVWGVAAGFMRLTRKACLDMVEAYADSWYNQWGTPEGKSHMLFDFICQDHEFTSEDYYFCHKYRKIGGKVWVDPDMTFAHVGQHAFVGNLGDHMRAQVEQKKAAD